MAIQIGESETETRDNSEETETRDNSEETEVPSIKRKKLQMEVWYFKSQIVFTILNAIFILVNAISVLLGSFIDAGLPPL